jgi:hypothetical protein
MLAWALDFLPISGNKKTVRILVKDNPQLTEGPEVAVM